MNTNKITDELVSDVTKSIDELTSMLRYFAAEEKLPEETLLSLCNLILATNKVCRIIYVQALLRRKLKDLGLDE